MSALFEALALVSFLLWVLVIAGVGVVWVTKGRPMMRAGAAERAKVEEQLAARRG